MLNCRTSNGDKFQVIESLKDFTLKKFIDFSSLVEPQMPELLKEIYSINNLILDSENKAERVLLEKRLEEVLSKIDDIYSYQRILPYYATVVEFWTGLDKGYILGLDGGGGMEVNQLKALYLKIMRVLTELPELEYCQVIRVNGSAWFLPNKHMMGSCVGDFAEAAQFQANMKKIAAGDWLSLAKVMCVLVRKKGERFSDKLLKRESEFLQWNMEDAWRVAFFLFKFSSTLEPSFQSYTMALRLNKLKQGLSN